jgi:hypothetical protein
MTLTRQEKERLFNSTLQPAKTSFLRDLGTILNKAANEMESEHHISRI